MQRFRPSSAQSEPNSQLLYTRRQAAQALGCSVDFIMSLERQGKLTPVRLSGPRGMVFFRHAELLALADGADYEAENQQ